MSAEPPRPPAPCTLAGLELAALTSAGLVDHIFEALAGGRGGWVVTANLDFARRSARDPRMRALYAAADLRVADGMPLVWASRLHGSAVPERIAGASLIWTLAERAAKTRRSLFLLGGDPGVAERAAVVLRERHPALEVAGVWDGRVGSPPSATELDEITQRLQRRVPDLLFVGLGSPKQEELIAALRARFPATWMLGLGASFDFVAGTLVRAPRWVQRAGLEWVHRLAQDPKRLARRYLVDDLPFAFSLFAEAWRARRAGGSRAP